MTLRQFLTRLGLVLAVAVGAALSLAGNASAQMALGGPYGPTDTGRHSQIQTVTPGSQVSGTTLGAQNRQEPAAPSAPSSPSSTAGGVGTLAYGDCGFYTGRDAWYRHCKNSWIIIRVNFWYGANYRDIWVGPNSTTNLSRHPDLQGAGLITNAWCIRYC
ncbi:hypothetical protein ALI22I_20070 [Saccharothrix sp. ALI-22-I]|uniref:DUF6355 family natural product biosynthesis protein n=1 Tax=Saccharothrix sp. ALI-22-I TaxID=1933778 RepID=UPI00097CB563|nr:DUF6355 family natural product biosynthesis protein [Saccharothrix sp. ALI-22-I]ONI88042.1 hypothetical protein ALI22I_20070 [Saccharothrix sp. ALI-22-I]